MELLSTRRRRLVTAAAAAFVAVPLVIGVAANAASATGTVNTTGNPGPALTVRAKPTAQSDAVGRRSDGARITIVCQTYGQQVTGTYGTTKIWDKVKSGGYVSDAYIRTGSDGLVAPLCTGTTPPTEPTRSARVKATIAAAKAMTGKYPYSWGGGNWSGASKGICCSPSGIDDRNTVGFDCSGLMEYAFFEGAGLKVSSTSRSQYADGPRVPIGQLKVGDMVFWSSSSKSASGIHHVALYIGNGQVVEADRVSGPDVRVRPFSTSESGVMPYAVRPIR